MLLFSYISYLEARDFSHGRLHSELQLAEPLQKAQ